MGNVSDGRAATGKPAAPASPVSPEEAARRAAALGALGKAQPAKSAGAMFWQQNGGRIVIGAFLLLGLVLIALGVGKFMRNSVSETARAEQALRRGMR